MVQKYLNAVRVARNQRKGKQMPYFALILSAVVIATAVYVLAAIVLIPSDAAREFNFADERGAATALSAIFLASSATFSIATMVVLLARGGSHRWVWLIMALGFAFLSFDELLQFHERVGRVGERVSSSGIFRSWNDVIVILYGFAALPVMALILPGLIRCPKVPEMFAIAFLFYTIHTIVDSTNEPPTTYSIIVEETAKLYCGAFLLSGTFFGFVANLLETEDRAVSSSV